MLTTQPKLFLSMFFVFEMFSMFELRENRTQRSSCFDYFLSPAAVSVLAEAVELPGRVGVPEVPLA